MLGVIFGVAAVIGTAAIGSGARDELQRQLAQLGTNTVRVRSIELKGKEESDARRLSPYGLTRDDLGAIELLLPTLLAAAPLKTVEAPVQSQSRTLPFSVYGTNDDLPYISGYAVEEGRFLSPLDVSESAQVVVIGADVRRAAFPLEEALGQRLLIGGQYYTVIGVMAARGQSGGTVIDVGDVDRSVYIPINSAIRRLGTGDPRADKLDEIALKVATEEELGESAALVRRMLFRRHNNVGDFNILVPEELIRQQQKSKDIFSQVLIFVAAISLLVGGIGIMNIMLATVAQRTREIGIRRALGATRRDILFQFLVESLIISLTGGVIGIGIGYAIAFGIGRYADWPIIVPIASVITSTSIAAAVGLLFGLYPSVKAASLDPIEALRAE